MKKSSSLLAIATVLFLIGCADDPKAIGTALLPPGDYIQDTVFTAFSDTTYKTEIMNGYASHNLVGKLPTGEEFITLLNFYPTSITDSLQGATIDTAEIRLVVSYRMLPSSPPIQLDLFEMLQPFSEGTFTADSLQPAAIGTISLGSFSDSMNYLQTVTAQIDTNAARRWADDYLDTTKSAFHGFAVKALSNTGVIGFTPFNIFSTVVPKLVIKYTRNGHFDSLFFSLGQDTYVGLYAALPVLSDFEVRGGTGIRSKIKFDAKFTGTPLLAQSLVILTVDTLASSYSGFSPDTLIALYALAENKTDSSFFAYGIKKNISGASPAYEFNITEMTQRWINDLTTNNGLEIRWWDERSASDRVVFYPITDATHYPKLKITYSEKK